MRIALALAISLAVAGAASTIHGHDAAPVTAKMRGICWEGGPRVDGEALDPIQSLGADWISQTPFGWATSVSTPAVTLSSDGAKTSWGYWGETDEGLTETARLARERGIRTLLKPHLWIRGGQWVGEIEMRSERDWKTWFDSYEAFILHYARLAERERMEGLAVGTELPKASKRADDWRRIIARVREVYHGPLTYCANWHEAENVGFWGDVDFVGVQAYYPLTKSAKPRPGEIRAVWSPIVARLRALSDRTGKRVVFTEVGYRSVAGSLGEPWNWDVGGEVDLEIQRDAYRAMFESLWAEPWFGGTFLWKWHPRLGALGPAVGRAQRDFTPQGKPALAVVREYYKQRR